MGGAHRWDIRRVRESDAELLREAVAAIAAERRYLATVDAFSLDETRAFIEAIIKGNLPQATALADGMVIGFCDIVPNGVTGFSHVARLGVGVRSGWRRQGIGRRLLDACLTHAKEAAIEKVELEVFSDNAAAVTLYESFGFTREGVKSRGRKLDGRYQDLLLMALWL